MTGVLMRKGNQDTDTQRGKTTRRHKEKTAIHKPRRGASEETSPSNTLISDHVFASDFQPPEL